MKQYLRNIPAVHELQKDRRFQTIIEETGLKIDQLTKWLSKSVSHIRQQMIKGEWNGEVSNLTNDIFEHLREIINQQSTFHLQRVINGTGTVLHTNLGRAKLSKAAIEHVIETAENYSNLEFDLLRGKRGSRHDVVEGIICEVTGAESAMVVNNNAAAVYLILKALANEKEVVVSRGELVEIGGSFRVSSIMEESGAKLVEVGTTNKTHLFDYEQAINEQTAMLMKVHTSNFKTIGFTKSVESDELVSIKEMFPHLIVYEDLGSGALFNYSNYGIGDEPHVKDVLAGGIDLVSFSGDKLLGGPQAGIIAGRKQIIDKLKKHQLARVLRVDKMTLAALEATLQPYLKNENEIKQLPVVRDLLKTQKEINKVALDFECMVKEKTSDYSIDIVEGTSQVGGGTMPGVELQTSLVKMNNYYFSAQDLSVKLRHGTPSIVCRIKNDHIYLDFRTIDPSELQLIVRSLIEIESAYKS
ncbi:L-seryl-tRNA(Sec) selenium transferase [Bacillus solimangrovi]|uniref:L-seryl-tRNA(Sec) selenium transferase n=1 Tax=Bacillus solimangrovi TaxID=1305675 RepID=A0A1E5LEJ1_9BACI|nr:L-seryl-tRNA(Sec) selenium transferase [Bacillus solimangrovi]OEH92490.1 L-seryl-tRNA(Sec) selenium transferase [Bacillus solimangrovi]